MLLGRTGWQRSGYSSDLMTVEAAAATQKEVAPKRKYLHQIIPARASPSAHAPRTYHARDAHHACASTPQDALDNCSSACSRFDAEGMAADAADNARRWDEGVATAVRLERGGGLAKRELLEDAEEQRSERSNFWIEICRAENAASDAAFDAQESAYEAFLDEGEDQAAAAWVSDDDVFDGHYSDY